MRLKIMEILGLLITTHSFRTLLFASQPVPSFFARLRAIVTFPTPGTDTTSGRGITRTIVHAFAMRATVFAVKTLRAFRFASNSCFDIKAKTESKQATFRSLRAKQLSSLSLRFREKLIMNAMQLRIILIKFLR